MQTYGSTAGGSGPRLSSSPPYFAAARTPGLERGLAASAPAGRGPCGPPHPPGRAAPADSKWLPEPAEPPRFLSIPGPAGLPCRFAQNTPSNCPLPGIFLQGPGPALLKSFPPDPLSGISGRNLGLPAMAPINYLSPDCLFINPLSVGTPGATLPKFQ